VKHISRVNCVEMTKVAMNMKFSPLNVDFSSPSPNPLCSTRRAHVGVKEEYPLKVVIFLLLAYIA